jgi:hypothetical protein
LGLMTTTTRRPVVMVPQWKRMVERRR